MITDSNSNSNYNKNSNHIVVVFLHRHNITVQKEKLRGNLHMSIIELCVVNEKRIKSEYFFI